MARRDVKRYILVVKNKEEKKVEFQGKSWLRQLVAGRLVAVSEEDVIDLPSRYLPALMEVLLFISLPSQIRRGSRCFNLPQLNRTDRVYPALSRLCRCYI